MKVLLAFEKEDGTETPDMTVEEVNNGEHLEHGITNEHIKEIFFKVTKYMIEDLHPGVTLRLKEGV